MNKIFKVVFKQITVSWVAVSEMAQSADKKASTTSILPPPLIIILN
ncbi:MAG: ESPR domain-containing protein [Neisseriaceae bacterium]|nr:ESPR domain-containing protein [Neisseriaceae bacterium]